MTDSMDMNLGKLQEMVRDSKPGMLQTRLSNSTTNKNTHVTNIPNKIQTISITPESSFLPPFSLISHKESLFWFVSSETGYPALEPFIN